MHSVLFSRSYLADTRSYIIIGANIVLSYTRNLLKADSLFPQDTHRASNATLHTSPGTINEKSITGFRVLRHLPSNSHRSHRHLQVQLEKLARTRSHTICESPPGPHHASFSQLRMRSTTSPVSRPFRRLESCFRYLPCSSHSEFRASRLPYRRCALMLETLRRQVPSFQLQIPGFQDCSGLRPRNAIAKI